MIPEKLTELEFAGSNLAAHYDVAFHIQIGERHLLTGKRLGFTWADPPRLGPGLHPISTPLSHILFVLSIF